MARLLRPTTAPPVAAPRRARFAGFLLTVLASSAGVGLAPADAHAFCRATTSGPQPAPDRCATTGTPFYWESSCGSLSPTPDILPEGFTAETFTSAVDRAFARWNAVSCTGAPTGAATFRFASLGPCREGLGWDPEGPNANIVVFRPRWNDDAEHRDGTIAITGITYDAETGQILDADTELNLRSAENPTGFVFSTTGAAGTADLETILTHELGHTVGLAHSPLRSAVMYFSAGLGEQRRDLTEDDTLGACAIHPPSRSAVCHEQPIGGYRCGGCGCRVPPARLDARALGALLGVAVALAGWRFAIARRSARSRPRP